MRFPVWTTATAKPSAKPGWADDEPIGSMAEVEKEHDDDMGVVTRLPSGSIAITRPGYEGLVEAIDRAVTWSQYRKDCEEVRAFHQGGRIHADSVEAQGRANRDRGRRGDHGRRGAGRQGSAWD